jgi:hypothetical protein
VLREAQLAWARREGDERRRTVNEERNAPIRHLKAALGYRPAGGRIRGRGPLPLR